MLGLTFISLAATVDPSMIGEDAESLIRMSAFLLLAMLLIGGTAFLLIHRKNKREGQRRYAEILARRAADAAAGKPDRLTEIANSTTRSTFVDDAGATKPPLPNVARDRFLNS